MPRKSHPRPRLEANSTPAVAPRRGSSVRHAGPAPRLWRAALPLVCTLLLTASAALRASGQTSDPTDGGTPSGLAHGGPAGEIAHVNTFNGDLVFRLPLLRVGGRGGAGASVTLARNSIHWVAQRFQDRQIITYTPKPDLNGRAVNGPFYEPARLYTQSSVNAGAPCLQQTTGQSATTLKRFILVTPDGQEYELRDQLYDGEPRTYSFFVGSNGVLRGAHFRSADGSGMTFISDVPIYDNCSKSRSSTGTGHLLMADGSRYRFVDGRVRSLRDRNGNVTTFTYGADPNDQRTYRRVIEIKDSLNRKVTVTYSDIGVVTPPVRLYDQITYKGFGGTQRSIKVHYSELGQALRPGYTLQTHACLFPNLNSNWVCGGTGGGTTVYNPNNVVQMVELPGGRRYRLYYNPYKELARLELATGGALEFDYSPQNPDYSTTKGITRQIAERRVYLNASDSTAVSRQTYSFTVSADTSTVPTVFTTTSVTEYRDPTNLLLSVRRSYHGAGASKALLGFPPSYKAWNDGLEFLTEVLDSGGAVVRSVSNTWQQRAHVSWWPQPTTSDSQANEPQQDPRLAETVVTFADTGQVSKRTFSYSNDLHNNLTDVYDYDFGADAPGPLLRRTHTDYLTTNPVNGLDYADPANGQSYTLADPHLRRLPAQTSVYDAAGSEVARTTYEYDNYASDAVHAPLTERPDISGLDASFDASYSARGNVTRSARWLLPSTPLSSHAQFDIAGNVVKTIDPNGHATAFSYDDNFGAPDGEARTHTAPTELATPGQSSYALVTVVTNPLGHAVRRQYDYNLGVPVDGEDANGVVSSSYYNDPLDRVTRVIAAANKTAEKSQVTTAYDDVNRKVTITSDLSTYSDNLIKRELFHDGLGRTAKRLFYESATTFVAKEQKYDALGRLSQVSNPYRAGDTVRWMTMTYDALDRVLTETTTDGAVISFSYSGNAVTVTDQAGKQRRRVTDALGRLTSVVEDPSGLNYQTNYFYDALDNLRRAQQGTQNRYFRYDSLSRLTRARNPEQGTCATHNTAPDPLANNNSAWSESYSYDANGNLTARADARCVTLTYASDALNRTTSIDYSNTTDVNPDVTFAFDGATNGRGRFWYDYAGGSETAGLTVGQRAVDSYDALGRPLVQRQRFKTNGAWAAAAFVVRRTYDLAGNPLSQTYPSGHVVTYSYDVLSRARSFSGNLGDGAQRAYSAGITYSEWGTLRREQFGTATPVYNKRFYNVRGQLSEIRESTYDITVAGQETNWNRGAIINHYSHQSWAGSGTDNNSNLRKQDVYIPNNDAISDYSLTTFFHDYDALNRLFQTREVRNGQNSWVQDYDYDRWGNRTLNAANSFGGVPEPQFTVDAATNRLGVPTGQPGVMTYDAAGNLTTDTYTGGGTRSYDAQGRMTSAQFVSGQLQTAAYTYDAGGRRVRRSMGASGVVWEVYGMDGELLADYAAAAAPSAPQREYGYRAGELLVVAEAKTSTRVNVALSASGATATASSTYDANRLPSAAINGDRRALHYGSDPSTGSGWVDATAGAFPDWLEVAFSGSKTIDEIDVITLQDNYTAAAEPTEAMTFTTYGLTAFDVQYWNGSAWATVPGGAVTGNNKVWRKFTFPAVTTTKIRVLTHGGGGGYSRVVELEAHSPAGGVKWLVADQLGTPRMVIDQTGSLAGVQRHDYLPFGEEVGAGLGGRTTQQGYGLYDGVRQKFTGKERDGETALDYFVSRYYSGVQGRFTSPDSVAGNAGSPQTLNRYAYVVNNPVNLIDPTGHAGQNTSDQTKQNPNTPQDPNVTPASVDASTLTNPLPGGTSVKITYGEVFEGEPQTDVSPLTDLQIMTGMENPFPRVPLTQRLFDSVTANKEAMLFTTVVVPRTGPGVGIAAGGATVVILGAASIDIIHEIGQSIADAIPDTADPPDPGRDIVLYRGLNGTNPGAFRVDTDGVSVFEVPSTVHLQNLPIRARYYGPKVPGTVAILLDPGLAGGVAVHTPHLGGQFHWSLRFPGQSDQQIKETLSKFAKSIFK